MTYWRLILVSSLGVATGLPGLVATAQPSRVLHSRLEAGGLASTAGATPFWLRANQYGTVPLTTPLGTFRLTVASDYVPPDTIRHHANRLGWGFAVTPVVNMGGSSQILLPEAHVKLKYGAVELWAGRRRELIGLGDSSLSSGFVIGAGNALPIPKIQLATRGYVPLKFLKSFVAVNAGFAHGWFLDTYIQRSYLHQKYVYWRFGKPTSSLNVHVGLNHQVQWGGQADYLLTSPYALNGKLPAAFRYYGNVVLASLPRDYENADYNSFDGSYRIGNHVGGHDLGIELTTKCGQMLLYVQHPFEDVSGLLFQNLPDGLAGFSWRRLPGGVASTARIDHVVAEFLTTINQSGPTFWRPNSLYQGGDNYFNHAQYREGWSYRGQAIGTPFIAPQTEFQPAIKQAGFFPDNRVEVYYVAAEGTMMRHIRWTTRLAYSRHLGTYAQPFDAVLSQFSGLLSVRMPVSASGKTQLHTSIALDRGRVYPETTGASLSIIRTLR